MRETTTTIQQKRLFENMVKENATKLHAYACYLANNNRATGSDVFQNALTKAYLNFSSFDQTRSFKNWMCKIIKNEFYNFMRSDKSYKNLVEKASNVLPTKEESLEARLINEDKSVVLSEMISSLPEIHRNILTMIAVEEKSYKEMSDILGISMGAVKSRVFKAKKRLEEVMSDYAVAG